METRKRVLMEAVKAGGKRCQAAKGVRNLIREVAQRFLSYDSPPAISPAKARASYPGNHSPSEQFMKQLGNSPFGFEDGRIVSYSAVPDLLSVVYEFWNETRSLLVFDGFLAMHDHACLGVTIGSTYETNASELIAKVIRLQFDDPPSDLGLVHYAFSDVDDNVVFEVIAKSCRFHEHTCNANEA